MNLIEQHRERLRKEEAECRIREDMRDREMPRYSQDRMDEERAAVWRAACHFCAAECRAWFGWSSHAIADELDRLADTPPTETRQ